MLIDKVRGRPTAGEKSQNPAAFGAGVKRTLWSAYNIEGNVLA